MNQESPGLMREVEILLRRSPEPFRAPEQVLAFETDLAHVFGAKEAIAVSSGTAALHCALAALDIGPGDQVLVPAMSVVMSVAPVLYQNATPIFVDSEPGRVDFDYTDMEGKLSSKVRAVLPVHMWGCSYDMSRLIEFAHKHGLAVVEDACQAHGSRWGSKYLGTWGDLGCFSMKDGKLLSTGEGGFVLTDCSNLAQRCRAFRSHWIGVQNPELSYARPGCNYRLTELQALLARWQINRFDEILHHRRYQTEYILEGVAELPQLEPYRYGDIEEPNYFCPVLLLRDEFATRRIAEELWEQGVANSVGTFGLRPVQERLSVQELAGIGQNIQGGNKAAMLATVNTAHFLNRILALLLLPHYSESELDAIIQKVEAVLRDKG